MKKKVDVYICDHCGEEFKVDHSKIGGSSSPAGWFFLSQYHWSFGKSPIPDTHLCSVDCLVDFIEENIKD